MQRYVKFKGTVPEYRELHYWVVKMRGKPNKCEHCGCTEGRRFDWANVSGQYKRDLTDWIRLCRPCHGKYDRRPKLLYDEYCKRGHRMTIDNLYLRKYKRDDNWGIECKECRNLSRIMPLPKPEVAPL